MAHRLTLLEIPPWLLDFVSNKMNPEDITGYTFPLSLRTDVQREHKWTQMCFVNADLSVSILTSSNT